VKYLATLCTGLRTLMIAALAGAPSAAHAQSGTDRETAEWNAARGAGTPDAYQRYLEVFPLGRYSGDAFRCIIELTVAPDAVSSCASAPGAGLEASGVSRAAPGAGPGNPVTSVSRGLAVDLY
jgi:hypothetical protein